MTAQLLANELTNLIQESKRKHSDLRQAAEKSLEELKSLKISEAQIGAELSQRGTFVNPFIIACGTKNAKFTGIAIVCLQRLVAVKGLPRPRLNQVLEALREATSAGLDVQLKILQALPSLLQNYSSDVKADLLVTALNICFILQSSKNAIVNNTSAATLQQLVVSVFDKVVTEDRGGNETPTVGEAPTVNGAVQLRPAALDAYRVFNDICLLTESQRPEYLRFSGLSQPFGLELIESVLTNHAGIFPSHPEQAEVLRTKLMPFIMKTLSGKPNFPTTVRLMRILFTLLRRHMSLLPVESGNAVAVLTTLLDHDSLWKRSLCMEVFRGIFAEPGLLRRMYMMYDGKSGEKKIIRNLTGVFVRISTEKPSVIGLGHQSTIPVANPYSNIGASTDQAMLEASGVTGIISGSVGHEGHNTGVSTQWSLMRVPCVDQLDKTEAPPIPESYIYSLTLACISSLSEGLAKFILPLTVSSDGRNRKRISKQDGGRDSPAPMETERSASISSKIGLERSASLKKSSVSVNPLLLEDHPLHTEIKACAEMIDECWPAILATCSTFLYASLDSEYYHGLVRSFQKFTHVAGLLQLTTPRDAFLTTLGKAAVPPNVFSACLNTGGKQSASTPTAEAPNNILSNARGLLSVDSLVSQSSSVSEKPRQQSVDVGAASLNTRNLLCLRALLNLGIALGPTLGSSWQIVLETLQQADFVLFFSGKVAGRTPIASRTPDQQADGEANALLANFGTEIKAVETAASRLFESTVDFSNASFIEVVTAVCDLLEKPDEPPAVGETRPQSPPSGGSAMRTATFKHKRVLSVSTAASAGPSQQDQFALAKLGDIASINLERLMSNPPDASGWSPLVSELISTLSSTTAPSPVRTRAAEILVRLVLEVAGAVAPEPVELRGTIQLRLLEAFRDGLAQMQREDRSLSATAHATDVDIHRIVLDGLKSILENCGETLVSGWGLTFEIIDSIFLSKRFASEDNADSVEPVLMTRSTRLIKPSFSSLQLICSDFLPSLPNSCFLHLVDTLYKFCSQDDDLNVALTTVTFFWAISDFLSGKSRTMSITEAMVEGSGDKALVELASNPSHPGSGPALWMLLLLRLTNVTTDQRLELRNGAIQILLRIIHAYGSTLKPEAWSICIKSVIFPLLSSIEGRLQSAHDRLSSAGLRSDWDETAVVIVNGVSGLLANYLDVLTAHPTFASLWQELLSHFTTMLDFKALEINSATFSSLSNILSKCEDGSKRNLDKTTIDLAWDMWARGLPVPETDVESKNEDNQKCLLSWVEALLELYRLIKADLDLVRVKRMLALLRDAMLQATPGSYASDIEYVTPVQGRILEVCKIVRTDIPGVPSAMITQVAEFASLAFNTPNQLPSQRRTFVAMSKESMPMLHHHITRNASDADIFTSGALSEALLALAKPIMLKYRFPIVTKSVQPWREATKATLAILEAALPHLKPNDEQRASFQETWHVIVTIANGIISADYTAAQTSVNITDDQQFDVDAFRKLRELVTPSLGADAIPDKTRMAYAEGLFRTSIIHAPAPAESELIFGNEGADVVGRGLSELYKPRHGRTIVSSPTKREQMSYVCLDELFSLVAAHDQNSAGPTIVVQPPTPRLPKKMSHPNPSASTNGAEPESTHSLHVRLARTAAPYLILRCALSIRAYIADHPLRGHMPQPLSQRRELSRILQCLVGLRSEPEAIPSTPNVDSEGRKHLLRLYPLLVKAIQVAGTAGDDKVLSLAGEALEVVGVELEG